MRNFSNTTLLCGDFNAKAPSWFPGHNNRKSIILEQLMDEFGFTCLNNGSPTFSTPDGVRSALDVTFIRYHQGNITWNALDSKICGSNHWPIIITFDDMECKTGKYNIFLAKKFLNKLNNMDVGENLEGFLVKINDTRKKCTLKVSPANRYVPKPWWNDELSRLF